MTSEGKVSFPKSQCSFVAEIRIQPRLSLIAFQIKSYFSAALYLNFWHQNFIFARTELFSMSFEQYRKRSTTKTDILLKCLWKCFLPKFESIVGRVWGSLRPETPQGECSIISVSLLIPHDWWEGSVHKIIISMARRN